MAINTEYQGFGENGHKASSQVLDHASKMVEEARAFGSAVSSSVSSMGEAIDLNGRVQRNPIGMVAIALGVGYLLGGGLFSPTTSRLLRLGVRLALVPILKGQLSALAEGASKQPESPAV